MRDTGEGLETLTNTAADNVTAGSTVWGNLFQYSVNSHAYAYLIGMEA